MSQCLLVSLSPVLTNLSVGLEWTSKGFIVKLLQKSLNSLRLGSVLNLSLTVVLFIE